MLRTAKSAWITSERKFSVATYLCAKLCPPLKISTSRGSSLSWASKVVVARQKHRDCNDYNYTTDLSDMRLLTPELAGKYGYPVETHKVTTEDGYVLTHHRIPNGFHAPPAPADGRPVIWLQHGFIGSSADWILNDVDKALAYRLADQGYDVWMGNARGNTYSKEHVSLNVKSKEFWAFSWHEMGKYDIPANIDYVLNVTGKPDMYYIGYSMGTTMFFVCMSLRPEYNSKIRLMSALAPVAYLKSMRSPIKFLAPFANSTEKILAVVGSHEFLPRLDIKFLEKTVCHQNSVIQNISSKALYLIGEVNPKQLKKEYFPIILGHIPAGASVLTLSHFLQCINSGLFCMFNFGEQENLEKYGQKDPPHYDLSKITVPIALYWGENDLLAVKTDIYKLAEQLPNVVRNYRVPYDDFNHLDFLLAIDSPTLLYKSMEDFMKSF